MQQSTVQQSAVQLISLVRYYRGPRGQGRGANWPLGIQGHHPKPHILCYLNLILLMSGWEEGAEPARGQLSIILDRAAVDRAAVDREVDLARTLLSGAQGSGPRAGDPIGP